MYRSKVKNDKFASKMPTLKLPPQVPIGIQFEWLHEELVVTAFVDADCQSAKDAGVKLGMVLTSINGNRLQGWSFPALVAALKSAASRHRTLIFTVKGSKETLATNLLPFLSTIVTPGQSAYFSNEPTLTSSTTCSNLTSQLTSGPNVHLQLPLPRAAAPATTTSVSHLDPFSTPSRRRRVYSQVGHNTTVREQPCSQPNAPLLALL
jgi:hypothetical protein